jgi:YHS domain-containing protein
MWDIEKNKPGLTLGTSQLKTVCGRSMTADILWYPRAEYQKKTIYFCTETCLDAFRSDPDLFYMAHSQQKK